MRSINIGRPLYIIDGYNVVFSNGFSKKGENIESLREELLRYLDNYRSKRYVDIVVVWDGSNNIISSRSYTEGRVKNLFSRSPENADSKIVKMVAKYENRGRIIVVSNDRRHITGIVKNLGAKTMSVEKFLSLIGYKRSNKDIGLKKENEKIDDDSDKLEADDLTVEEWLEIFKSKQKKENS